MDFQHLMARFMGGCLTRTHEIRQVSESYYLALQMVAQAKIAGKNSALGLRPL